MTYRKGQEKLNRPCKKCGKLFEPSGRCNWLCNDCNPKGQSEWVVRMAKLSKKVARRRKKLKKQLSEVPKSKDFRVLKGKSKKGKKPLYTTLPSK